MSEQNIPESQRSSVGWEGLEAWLRERVQQAIASVLEEEVTELLGRVRSQRRQGPDAPAGYRNGYGKPRRLTLSCGTIEVRRPRVRGLEERFESRILPLFVKRSRQVDEVLPQLYLHGLAERDFDLALRGLLGEEAPLSAATVARLKERWQAEYEAWAGRPLDGLEVVYLWVDGVYVKAGLEKDKAALLVAIGALQDGRKVVLAVTAGQRESTESWSALLRDLRQRGLAAPRMVIGDGHLGLWAGLRNVYPEAEEQRCWNHRVLNVLDRLPKRHQGSGKHLLARIPYADTLQQAEEARARFQAWCRKQGFDKAGELLDHDWERMVTFYRFPKAHWKHLRTSNVIESPFAGLRLRTNAAKRYQRVANATAVIWKMLLVAEQTFRRLDAPDLLPQVLAGMRYIDGVPEPQPGRQAA